MTGFQTNDYATEFDGQVVLVTGGASGIGLAVARRLAAGGAAVAIADHDEAGAKQAARKLAAEGARALAVPVDVTEPESVRAAVEATVDGLGGLHLAVNNAGVIGEGGNTADLDPADWRRVIATNLDGVFYSLHYELPAILACGGGAIVNMASALSVNGFPGAAAYVSAKHGVVGLTKTAALEYAPLGVRVNAVGPGFIDTPLLSRVDDQGRRALAGLHAAGRLGRAEEVAELVAFLLSARASYVQGSYHLVDGAYSAR